MTESENSDRNNLLELAAQLIASSTRAAGSLTECMADRFPWMLALSEGDQETCARDILNAARASFSTHQAHLAIAEITSWRETAIAIAAGLGDGRVQWLDEPENVERP
ncbi:MULTISPECIES: prevent-host-death protein [Brevibacterium]